MAKPGDTKNGEQIYSKRCVMCHGEEGDGQGAVTERLNPPPRDFSSALYKIKTTGFDDIVPNDEDIIRMIRDGMPGTAMPGWSDLLSKQDILDLVIYLKTFAGLEEEKPTMQLDYGQQVATSEESIAKGKELFHDSDRCSECHGEDGKGDATKRLKGDAGERTWPRNLTKPWTFRASNDPKDIFSRISVGIAGTEMPSFADPESKKKLSIEDRWHVANYVVSLAKTDEVVRAENTVIKADKIEGDVAERPDDERWQQSEPTSFFLIPQIIAEQRFFTPSNDTITVRAMYSNTDIAFLLEWDDRSQSLPGNEEAETIADKPISEDAVAIQLPVIIPEGVEKPYFGMGDTAHPVNIWHWKSGTSSQPESLALANSKGFKNIEKRDAKAAGLSVKSQYHQGTWRVVIKRPLAGSEADRDIQFSEGQFIPIAFAAWDGSNSETGSKHTMTTWYWLLLKPAASNKPLIWTLIVMLLIIAAQFWWQKSARQSSTEPDL
jgi:DMSO reductase family type II enzyme heme b subunit